MWKIPEARSHLGSKSSLGQLKKIEFISSIFSDHNTMRLEISYRKTVKNTNTWRLNNMLLEANRFAEETEKENT